jgi:hypothetical protein
MTILLGPQQHEGVATAFVGIGSRGATHRHHDRRGGGELACCLLLCFVALACLLAVVDHGSGKKTTVRPTW